MSTRLLTSPLDLTLWTQAPPPIPEWHLPGLYTKGSLILVAGFPGVGKSSLGYTLSLIATTGQPFLGHPVQPCTVVYFDEENSYRDMHGYFYDAWSGLGRPTGQSRLLLYAHALGTPHWSETLTTVLATEHPDLVFIDTVTPACRVEDENDNAEAARTCTQIRTAQAHAGPDCTIILYKHLRENEHGKVDVRGAKIWKGAVDAIHYHTRARGRPIQTPWGAYSTTYLRSEKKRHFGLVHPIRITPTKTEHALHLTFQAVTGEE